MPIPGNSRPLAVVIGGSNLDLKSRTLGRPVNGTSNPGCTTSTAGGVARNVAENLARLGVRTELVTALGADAAGEYLRSATEAAGVGLAHSVGFAGPSGTYTAVLDDSGELVIAVASMDAVDAITPAVIEQRAELICRAAILVLECNVGEDALVTAASIARDAGVPVVVDTVSVPKAARAIAILRAGIAIHTLTPNVAELASIAACSGAEIPELLEAARELHDRGAGRVWVSRGPRGSLLSERSHTRISAEDLPSCAATLVDATGAGDAMIAGYVASLLHGFEPSQAARHGRAAAAITIESPETVASSLTFAGLVSRSEACDATGRPIRANG